jgi:hypothetical protein
MVSTRAPVHARYTLPVSISRKYGAMKYYITLVDGSWGAPVVCKLLFGFLLSCL